MNGIYLYAFYANDNKMYLNLYEKYLVNMKILSIIEIDTNKYIAYNKND
jgi:hypothetical protein